MTWPAISSGTPPPTREMLCLQCRWVLSEIRGRGRRYTESSAVRLGVDRDQVGNVDPGSMRSGKERANLMHFIDPEELGGLHVIGRNDVTLGVVAGIYADIRSGYPQWAAIQSGLFGTDVSIIPLSAAKHGAAGPSAGRGAAPDARTRGVGRPMLHEHAVPSANQMS